MSYLTDQELITELRSESSLNRARREFSNYMAKIDQAQAQRKPITILDQRRMEFEAVERIVRAYNND